MKRASAVVGLVTASLMVTGCPFLNVLNQTYKKSGAAKLYRFNSAEELKEYLADQVQARTNRYQGGILPFFGAMSFDLAADSGAASPTSANGGGEEYSTTNLQEQGVDESDVMKNDANYVYALSDGKLRIAKVRPADEMEEVGALELDGYPDNLYLRGDQLVALSMRGTWCSYPWVDFVGLAAEDRASNDWQNETIVSLIDASDRSAPSVVKTYRLEGSLVSSRMIEGQLYLVLTVLPDLPPVADIPDTPLEDMLPQCLVEYGSEAPSVPVLLTDWRDFYRPEDPDGYGIVTVVTIDTTDPDAELESVAVTADAGLIYASKEALYITDTEWGYARGETEQTIIHKFAFAGGVAQYAASGKVAGRPLNQFSLGEYDGYLRIATTEGRLWSANNVSNNVFVLGEGETSLDVVGELRGIAKGEQIYSARFLGTRGFLVTFVNIDPLFTLDLSDPTAPKVVGELKVPGYSDYIHILDDNHLLTIGKDAEDVGDFAWYQGVQLSVFDITDFANPKLLHKRIIGGRGTESEALHDHRAFNFFASKDLLAIPIELYEGGTGGPTYGEHTFSGLYVFKVTVADGFELLGRISTLPDDATLPSWYYSNGWTRGVFIGEDVYAVTASLIRSAEVSDMENVLGYLEF